MVVLGRYYPRDGPWCRLVDGSHLRGCYGPCIAFGVTSTCAVQPGGGWDERMTLEHGGSEAMLHRVERPGQLGWFEEAVQAVNNDSWQERSKVAQRSLSDSRGYSELHARQALLPGDVLTVRSEFRVPGHGAA